MMGVLLINFFSRKYFKKENTMKSYLLTTLVIFTGLSTSIFAQENEQPLPGTADDEINIFETLKIDLKDLEDLGKSVTQRLVGQNVRMSLDDCVRMALANNQDILIAGYDSMMTQSDVNGAFGAFDPTISFSFQHADNLSPSSPLQQVFGGFTGDIESQNTNYQLQLNGRSQFGMQYDIGLSAGREDGTFSGDAIYSGGATTTLTQPLLRDYGREVNMLQIRSAEKSHEISYQQIQSTVINTIGEVIKAYWDLVGTIENLRVRQEALDNANRLVTITEKRLEIGSAAAIEVLRAKAGMSTRLSDLVTARTAILDAEDQLKNLIGLQDGEIFSPNSVVPTDRPRMLNVDWDLDRSIDSALKNRPDIKSVELQIEQSDLDIERTKNELLPQLDAQISYGQSSQKLSIDNLPHGILNEDGKSWTVGLSGSIPIGNRTARFNHQRSKLAKRQNVQRLKKSHQDVVLSVRTAVRGLVSSQILVEANRQARILQEANVAAEEKRLNLGVTTSQIVLDIQEDLTMAQTEEQRAIVNYEKAIIDLQVAEGTLLEQLSIDFAPPVDDFSLNFLQSINPARGM
jgi:outer membrane protein TolC